MIGLRTNRPTAIATTLLLTGLVTIGIFGFLRSQKAEAQENPRLSISEHIIQVGDQTHELEFQQYINDHNERELAVIHKEVRNYLPDSNVVVLYGRDTNEDGHYDAWFPMGKNGVEEVIERYAHLDDGWDVAYHLLRENDINMKDRWLLTVAALWLPNVTFSGVSSAGFFKKTDRAQMDLLDMEVRVDRMAKRNKNSPQLIAYHQYIAEGWQMLEQELQQYAIVWAGLVIVDATIGEVAPRIWTKIQPLFDKYGLKIVQSSLGKWAGAFYIKYIDAALSAAARGARRVLNKTPLPTYTEKLAGVASQYVFRPIAVAGLSLEQRMHYGIRALSDRGRLGKNLASVFETAVRSAEAGASQWRYIGQTALVQLLAEVAARSDTLFNANPIILAHNVANDKQLLQNLSYMTGETFLLSGVSSAITNQSHGIRICAVVATMNSASTNYIINGRANPERGIFDSTWESVIGVLQTKIDMQALQTFEQIGIQQVNPKLKLVGYAVAFVDQLVGYYGYSKATQTLDTHQKEETKKLTVRWIPIMAPSE